MKNGSNSKIKNSKKKTKNKTKTKPWTNCFLLVHIIYPALAKALLGAKMDQLIGCVTSRIILRLEVLSFSIRGTVVIFLPSCADFVFLSS